MHEFIFSLTCIYMTALIHDLPILKDKIRNILQ